MRRNKATNFVPWKSQESSDGTTSLACRAPGLETGFPYSYFTVKSDVLQRNRTSVSDVGAFACTEDCGVHKVAEKRGLATVRAMY